MRAISLWQPWASFIAAGVKPYETRHWAPPVKLIGQHIAIHAAKRRPTADDMAWARDHLGSDVRIDLGAVVCIAVLAGAYQCAGIFRAPPRDFVKIARGVVGSQGGISIVLDEYGDYSEGRWAWLLTDIEPLRPPVPARGAQGFFEWQPPTGAADG